MSQPNDRRDALNAVIARATTDPAFRQKLLRDPQGAILEATGTPVSVRVKFVEKDPDVDVHIVLPDLVAPEPELTTEELDAVAGGTNWCEFSCEVTSE